jgi:hypothetical protein
MIRLVLLLTLSGMLSLAGLAVAAEAEDEAACDTITQRQQNQVVLSMPELTVDEATATTEDLAVMSGLYNDIGRSIGGITSATPLVEYKMDSSLALLPDQRGVCAKPAITLRLGYQTLGVYMDREIPRSSCIYNAIFAHEMHHVAIYKDYLTRHLEEIRQGADAKFNGRAYFFPTLFQAKQYLEILGEVYVGHVREKFLHEVNAEQRALDTQAEYSRMQMECSH